MKVAQRQNNFFSARTLIWLGLANMAVIVVLQIVGQALQPGNIIAFEFAGSATEAHAMMADWQGRGVLPQLFFHLGFDYVFMITYSSFLFVSCYLLQRKMRSGIFFSILAWLQPVAALLDAVENAALYQIAIGAHSEIWPRLSFYCAAPKFLIVLTALVACSVMGVYFLFQRE
jgi:hypothetical protein